jgi:hypothetical protein
MAPKKTGIFALHCPIFRQKTGWKLGGYQSAKKLAAWNPLAPTSQCDMKRCASEPTV